MKKPLVTVLVPHYKTLELTKLCLRLLRKHTDPEKMHVLVIDNGSNDESSEYLKTLSWIELHTRQPAADEEPAMAHSLALDEGLALTKTPYVLSIHTDTLIKSDKWLGFLIRQIEENGKIAGVGSWKLEQKPWYKRLSKTLERFWQLFWFKLIGKKDHLIDGVGNNFRYLRSHCALYRTGLLKEYNLSFADVDVVAGKTMHKKLLDLGYEMKFIASPVLIKYLHHVNHATMALNPELGARKRTITKGMRRIEQTLKELNAEGILQDTSLDS